MNELLRKRARYLLADTLHDPIIIFDKKNFLADYNREAAEKFSIGENNINVNKEVYLIDITAIVAISDVVIFLKFIVIKLYQFFLIYR